MFYKASPKPKHKKIMKTKFNDKKGRKKKNKSTTMFLDA